MPDNIREVYRDLGENLRHIGRIQFTQVTIWVPFFGGSLLFLLSDSVHLSSAFKIIISGTISLFSLMFWLMHRRFCSYWNHYLSQIKVVEAKMLQQTSSIVQYQKGPGNATVSNRTAIDIVYWTGIILPLIQSGYYARALICQF